jgi:hypothetical protein
MTPFDVELLDKHFWEEFHTSGGNVQSAIVYALTYGLQIELELSIDDIVEPLLEWVKNRLTHKLTKLEIEFVQMAATQAYVSQMKEFL